jgi:Ca-activated chloride channel homolog
VNRLKDSTAKTKLVILLTDGENTAGEVDPITASQLAHTFGIKVYTVGVGKGGLVPYPFRDPLYGVVYQQVDIPIDEKTLTQIASNTGARFFRAKDAETLKAVYTELAPRFMAASLGFLLLEIVLTRTRLGRIP